MSAAPWTPGPHRADWTNVFDANGNRIAMCDTANDTLDRMTANAHLYAAASDMYAALEKMGSYFPHSIVECRGDKCREPWCASCYGEEAAEEAMARVAADIAAYRAALAKARGQA